MESKFSTFLEKCAVLHLLAFLPEAACLSLPPRGSTRFLKLLDPARCRDHPRSPSLLSTSLQHHRSRGGCAGRRSLPQRSGVITADRRENRRTMDGRAPSLPGRHCRRRHFHIPADERANSASADRPSCPRAPRSSPGAVLFSSRPRRWGGEAGARGGAGQCGVAKAYG